jgi:adenylylsulfate kinase
MKSFVLWFTGLSGSGKSTIADRVYNILKNEGHRIERLDGDTVRDVFPKTGFSKEERNEHVKRIGFLASILERNDVAVLASFISPYREAREFVRNLCTNFIEVYVDTPIEICESRDVKGLYQKARSGEISNFTGIDDPYEAPSNPELIIATADETIDQSVAKVLEYIKRFGYETPNN